MPCTLNSSLCQLTLVALPVSGCTAAFQRVIGFHLPGRPVSTSGGEVYDWRMTAENAESLVSDTPASPGVKPKTLLAQIICGPRHNSRCVLLSASITARTSSPAANSVAVRCFADPFQVMVCTDALRPGVRLSGVPPT